MSYLSIVDCAIGTTKFRLWSYYRVN